MSRQHVPCFARHPKSGHSCAKPGGHEGPHHSSGPGFSEQWHTDLEALERAYEKARADLTAYYEQENEEYRGETTR